MLTDAVPLAAGVLLPATGQINLFGTDLTFLAGSYVDKSLSWGLVLLAVAGFAVFRYLYTSDAAKAPRRPLLSLALSLDSWAVIAASALIIATLIGTLPRIPW